MIKLIRIVLLAASILIYPLGGDTSAPVKDDVSSEHPLPSGPRPVPGWPVILGNCIKQAPAVADIDGDGRDEIAVGLRDGRVFLLGPNGTVLPGWPREMASRCFRGMMLDDIDGDGSLEVGAVSYDGKVHMWRLDGETVEGWPVDIGAIPVSAPRVVIDGDRRSILLSSSNGYISLLSPDGEYRKGWPVKAPHLIPSTWWDRRQTIAADLDGDGTREILHYATQDSRLFAWDLSGEELEGFPLKVGDSKGYGMAVDDASHVSRIAFSWLNGLKILDIRDGSMREVRSMAGDDFFTAPFFLSSGGSAGGGADIVGACTIDGAVYLWDLDGRPLEGWPVRLSGFIYGIPLEEENHMICSPPLARDWDGDGRAELLVGCFDQHLYGFDIHGNLLPGWPVRTGDALAQGLALAQLDGVGAEEVLAGQAGETMYAFSLDAEVEDRAASSRGIFVAIRSVSEWPGIYFGVSAVVAILLILLIYRVRFDLAPERVSGRKLLRFLVLFLLVVISVRLVLLAQGMRNYLSAKELLEKAEPSVEALIDEERFEAASLAREIEADLDSCAGCEWSDPLQSLRSLERLSDHHRLEYDFKGLMLVDGKGEIVRGVGLARGWTSLSQMIDTQDGKAAPSMLGDVPVFSAKGERTIPAGDEDLHLVLVSSILEDLPAAIADSTGCTANIIFDGRTLAVGGASIRPRKGLRPWLGLLHPGKYIDLADYPDGSRLGVFLTIEDFERPFIKWVDLVVVLLVPLLYLIAVTRGGKPGAEAVRPRWWWILSFGALYIAGTVMLSGWRLQPMPVPIAGRILEVLIHLIGLTGVVVALHAIIRFHRGRRLNFALLVSYLVVSLIPMLVIVSFFAAMYHSAQHKVLEDAMEELGARADNMILAYFGNPTFNKSMGSGTHRSNVLCSRPREPSEN